MHPATRSGWQQHARLQRAEDVGLHPAADGGGDPRLVAGMDDRPCGGVGRVLEGQLTPDDVDELGRTPECLGAVADFEHAGMGGIEGHSQALGVDLRFAARLGQRQLLALAGIDVQQQGDDLDRAAVGVELTLAVDLDPADRAVGLDDAEVERLVPGSLPGLVEAAESLDVLGVAARPDARLEVVVVDGPADDVGELLRAPEASRLPVEFANAGAGGAHGETEALRVGLRFATRVGEGQFLTLAGVDVEDQADHLGATALRIALLFAVDLDPARLPGRQKDAEVDRLVAGRGPVGHRRVDQVAVVRVGHVPGFAREPAEVDVDADDFVELGRGPHGLVGEVELRHARVRRAHGQAEPFGVGLRLAACGHQRRHVVPVGVIDHQRAVGVEHRPVLAAEPASNPVAIDVFFIVVDEVLAVGGALMQVAERLGRGTAELLDGAAEIVLVAKVGDLLPALAGGEEASIHVEKGHGHGRVARDLRERPSPITGLQVACHACAFPPLFFRTMDRKCKDRMERARCGCALLRRNDGAPRPRLERQGSLDGRGARITPVRV